MGKELNKCRVKTVSVNDTERLGEIIGKSVPAGSIILLFGDLGCGKTVLTKGIAKALGISKDEVSSPSFNILHEYRSLVHIDFYRLNSVEALKDLGFEDILMDERIKVIEWPQIATGYFDDLGAPTVKIDCFFLDDETREFELVESVGLCKKLKQGGFHVKDS